MVLYSLLAATKPGGNTRGNYRCKVRWISGPAPFFEKGSRPRMPSSLHGQETDPQSCTELPSSGCCMRNLTLQRQTHLPSLWMHGL